MDKKKKSYTEEWFTHTPTVWQDSLKGVPDFDIEKLKHYLIESREKSFDKDRVRAYKSLKAFKYFEEGFVQRLRHSECDDDGLKLYVIHAKVLASYQGKAYQTYVALDKDTGRPIGGACACVAGLGEACSHIAAILFAIEDYIAKGLNQLPDDPSCTDRLCAWNVPSKQNVEPDTIHEIRIVKQEHGKVLKERQTFDSLGFDPRQEADRNICKDLQKELIANLRVHNPSCNFLRYCEPFESVTPTAETLTTPDSCALTVMPPSLQEIRTACEKAKHILSVTDEERHKLERTTIGQSDSVKWKSARKYRLTSSNFHRVYRMKAATNPKVALDTFLYKTARQTSAMAFGIQQEEAAARRYSEKTKIKLMKKGLVVDKDYPYLGASVDRVTDDGETIVEIKNPMSTWESSIRDAAKKLKCLKLDENDEVVMNTNDAYYTQVQGQMGILGVKKCHFLLCTQYDMLIHEVLFDEVFWENCKKKLVTFYENIMLPEIVYPRVKYNLDPHVYKFLP